MVHDASKNATDFAREYDAKHVLIDVHVRDPGFAETYRHRDHAEIAQHMHQRAGSEQRPVAAYLLTDVVENVARAELHDVARVFTREQVFL